MNGDGRSASPPGCSTVDYAAGFRRADPYQVFGVQQGQFFARTEEPCTAGAEKRVVRCSVIEKA
jgi:hypothetical protein